ncbi:c-type cytochrome [bacterium]|nr:c-type cytochrome [bacterium]
MKFLLALFMIAALPVWAQWKWPEKGQNLKILPKDTKPEELRNAMIEHVNGLGVRCTYCHVGEEGKPLTEFDFLSDAKRPKLIAREMMAMVKTINSQLIRNAVKDNPEPIEVTCTTCHHGSPKPRKIEDLLIETYTSKGVDSLKTLYKNLREQYYGSFVYDFREGVLLRVCDRLKTADDAAVLANFNAEFFPTERTYMTVGGWMKQKGDKAGAIQAYEKVLSINPKNAQAQKQINELKK